jgi:hypothetical protein
MAYINLNYFGLCHNPHPCGFLYLWEELLCHSKHRMVFYPVTATATAMNIGKFIMDKWVRQLKEERAGKPPKASPMTPEQIEIRERKKRLQRVEIKRCQTS